ncbi:hypothetical protein [Streptomyces sp. NBC_01794]|uniref:hypothetical protein n=1 Tax=Streptomyces sp. NBC_01794 TaxID=2975942 RepID=UPI003087607C|nr:hypothetical protein OIE54_11950 [Streptomyces sp. NBC_01794]
MTFAPRTWVVGETVGAATMNTEIRDQFNSIFDPWTTYTPTWAGGSPVIGNGTLTGRHMKVGRTCHVAVKQQNGSTTTYGSGGYTWTLPFAAASATVDYLGSARLVGSDAWFGQCIVSSGGSALTAVFPATTTNTRSATMTPTVPETFINAAILRMSITYQTAS